MANDESTTPEGLGEAGAGGLGSAGGLEALVRVSGPAAALAELVERLARQGLVAVQIEADPSAADAAWELLPRPLSATERAIVQHDLRGEPRRRIAALLELSAGTVTVYRRLIRAKFQALPPAQRPAWMRGWLRRFPGAPRTPPAPGPTDFPS